MSIARAPFSQKEYDRRLENPQGHGKGWPRCHYCYRSVNMAWLTGYDGWSFMHQAV